VGRKFVRTGRRYCTIEIQASITAADPVHAGLRGALGHILER
jgi:hypothetical protein